MSIVVSASEARQTLPAQLDQVERGETVSITRHGRVVAVLVPPGMIRSPRTAEAWAAADRIREMLDRARREPLRGAAISSGRADELVDAIRADRDAR